MPADPTDREDTRGPRGSISQFDSLIEKMQTSAQRRGVERIFRMIGEEMGEAARQVDEGDSI